jgi:hypothetical protein
MASAPQTPTARGRRNGSPSGERSRRKAMGIRDRPTSFRSPWQNGYAERLIGSVRCTRSTFAESMRNIPSIIMRCERMFRSGRTRPAHARSSGSETLLRIQSLAGYIIGTLESRFRKRQHGLLVALRQRL